MTGAAFAIPAMAAEPTAAEEANRVLVADFLRGLCHPQHDEDRVVPGSQLFLPGHGEPPCPAVERRRSAVERIKSHVERSSTIEVQDPLDSWARGPMVINERIDSFTRPDASPAYHLVGVFLIKDGKIAEWTDYGIRG